MLFPFLNGNFSTYKEDYLLELEIPSINLDQFVYDIDSWKNNVDFHVELLESSDLNKNVYFFAAHSGDGAVSYFNNLSNIEVGDSIVIKTREKVLFYVVMDCYFIHKSGYLEVEDNLSDIMFLITCSLEEMDQQLVVRARLV